MGIAGVESVRMQNLNRVSVSAFGSGEQHPAAFGGQNEGSYLCGDVNSIVDAVIGSGGAEAPVAHPVAADFEARPH